jgi:monoamine oxidase
MSAERAGYDVVVIGGGFAGVVAARDLTEQGNRVLLLEARNRLGGRTYSSKFPGTDLDIELGGQFVRPGEQPGIAWELERYGVSTAKLREPEALESILNGTRYAGAFPPREQIPDIERAALHCVLAAARIDIDRPLDQQDLADLDIPLSDFLAPLDLPPETYDFVTNVCSLSTFRYPEEQSAITPLVFLAHFGLSVYTWFMGVSTRVRTATLVERIAADVTEVRLGCPVVRVDQTGDDVLVTTAGSETVTASAVVVSTPVNVWNDIEFAPRLSEEKRITSSERHAGDRTAKAALRVRNVPLRMAISAAPRSTDGAYELYTEDEFENGDQLMNLFAWTSVKGDEYHLDLDERESIERALAAMLPGAELVESISHNWITDPFSQGGPISWRPGRITTSHSILGTSEGRLAFATSDIAQKWICTIEGAIESGHKAARETLTRIASERETAVVRSANG